MPATIEHLPPKWKSSAAKSIYDMLMSKIEAAFEPPRPASDSWTPQQFAEFKVVAQEATAWLMDQAIRLHTEFTQPVFVLHVSSVPQPLPPDRIIKAGA